MFGRNRTMDKSEKEKEKEEANKKGGETPKTPPPESPGNRADNAEDQKEKEGPSTPAAAGEGQDNNAEIPGEEIACPFGPESCPSFEEPEVLPPPTLEKLSEEIDLCIASLPRTTPNDDNASTKGITPNDDDAAKDEGEKQENDAAKDEDQDQKAQEEEKKDDKVDTKTTWTDLDEIDDNYPARKTERNAKQDDHKDEKEDPAKSEDQKEERAETDDKKDEKAEEGGDAAKEEEKDPIPAELPKLVEAFLNLADDICSENRSRWGKVPEDDALFLEAVDRMANLRESLLSMCSILELKFETKHGGLINRLGGIQHRAFSYLEEEFRLILEECRTIMTEVENHSEQNNDSTTDNDNSKEKPPESESEQGGGVEFSGYEPEALSHLHKIATEMISGGYEPECAGAYLISRRHAFDESLQKLGIGKHSLDEIQKMHWESLEREIVNWVKAFKHGAPVLISSERKLAEAVFSGSDHSIATTLFGNLSRGVMVQLLNFAEGIAMSKRSAEKLFKTVDMYEVLREVGPKMDEMFPEECVNEMKTEAMTVRSRLGESAICIFCDLENSIKAETGRNPVPGGAVHPLTRYTLNYLRYACEYKDTLEHVFKEHSKIERADSTSRPGGERDQYNAGDAANNNDDEESPFSVQLNRVMDLLDSNLEGKAKLYKDVALSSIFMMNNGRYILQKIKGSPEINACMGDTWSRRKSSELRQYHQNYKRETWNKLLHCLSHDGLSNHGKILKPVLKERFKSFNAMFDEIHKTQSTWVVSDEQLQSELRVSISAIVIPAYRSFLGRFAQVLDPGRQTEKYIKFQPEDIETFIDELFDGNPNSSIFRKRP